MADDTEFEKKRKRNASGESTFSNDSLSNYIPTPPDGGWGWVIVFASFVNHIIVDGITFTFGVFYMEFVIQFKESKGKTALVGSLLAGFYLMTGPIASALVNRYGCRAVCVAGAIVASAAFVFATLAKSIDVLMLTYGVMAGFGFGLIYLPSVISVSYYFEKKRALATGIAVCGAGVGGFIFAPAGRVLLTYFDWKNSLYIVAGITMNAAVMGALMRPLESPKKKKPRRKNFFDRLREQAFQRNRSASTDTNTFYGVKDRDNIVQRVQEAKEAREQKLRDEEGDSEFGSIPNSCVNSLRNLKGESAASTRNNSLVAGSRPISQATSRKNSAFPATPEGVVTPLLLNQDADDLEDHAVLHSNNEEPDSMPASRRTSHKTAIPAHVRKEIEMNHKNNLSTGCVPTAADHLVVDKQHLKPTSGPHSISVSDVMAFNPRRRSIVRAPVGATKEDYARPLYRRDIFYSGSILHIPNFRSQPDFKMYVASITTIPNDVPPEKESRVWRCLPIPKTAKDVLKDMLDISLLKDPVFLIACLGEVFGFIGLFIPFVYVTERAMVIGVPETQASFLLSVIGITNTVGRIVSGFLADFPQVNSLLLHNIMMILGGVACCMNTFATSYPLMITFCAFFGLCVATYISLTSIILCNLMGLEKLTSAFGFLTMVRGLASIAGPPVAGMVFDATGDFDMSFHVGGAMFIIAGGLYCLLHLPIFSRNMIQKVIDEHLEETITEVTITPDVKIEVQSPEASLLAAEEKPAGSTQEVCAEVEQADKSRDILV